MNKAAALHGFSLALFTGLATFALMWSTEATSGPIQAERARDFNQLLSQVIPDDLHTNSLLEDTVERVIEGKPVPFTFARKEGEITAIAFRVSSDGYSGAINMLVAVDPNGVILGVRVTSHTETPGLGDKIEVQKGDWIHKFDGKSLKNPALERWGVTKDGGDFDALTGATITPRAVVKGVKEGLQMFEKERATLLSQPAANAASAKQGASQ